MIVALVFVAAWLAFVVSAVAGGGAGLVLVPLLRLLLPVPAIPAALSIGTATSSVARIWLFRRAIRWDVVRRFVPTALPAAALGAWLLSRFEPAYVEFLLGCFLLANLPALLRRAPADPARPVEGPADGKALRLLPWLGLAAGFLSGFTGAVGVIFNRAYTGMGLARHEIVATRATNEVLLHLLKLALYAGLGLVTRSALIAGAVLALAAALAAIATRPILARLPEGPFRRIGLAAMVVSGIAMFSLSGARIVAIHRVWVEYVAPEDEHELQLFWGGDHRGGLEREDDGTLVVERTVPAAALPAAVRAAVAEIARGGTIVRIEAVDGAGERYYEVYRRRGITVEKLEVTPAGLPRHRLM